VHAPAQLEEKALSRLELLEKINRLNTMAEPGERYWTVTVLYNTIIFRQKGNGRCEMLEFIYGVTK
jgi:hypothetical protein